MKTQNATLARVACGLSVGLGAARLVLAIAHPESAAPISDPRVPGGGLSMAAFEASVVAGLGVIGAIVASRQPRNPVSWIMCAVPLFLGLLIVADRAYWSVTLTHPGPSGGADLLAWLLSWVWIPAIVPALTLFPLLFPSGRPPTPRWRPVAWAGLAACPLIFLGIAFTPGPLEEYPQVSNPLGVSGGLAAPVEVVGGIGFGLMIAATLAAAASLIVRFRRSRGVERQQLKWVTAAAALLVVLFAAPPDSLIGEELAFACLLLGLLGVGVAVAIAMLRYRLYDIDVVINRTLVYGALTATLAGAYLGSVLVLQLALSGVTEGSGLAVAASTLAVAALFRPVRGRIQEAVDRRFFRRRYDAQRTLESFGTHVRDEVALDSLSSALRGVVRETMQPAHVSLWLRAPQRRP